MALVEVLPQQDRDTLEQYPLKVEDVAQAYLDNPLMLPWLEGFHRTVIDKRNHDGKELPEDFFDRTRGEETVRFDHQIYTGVTADLRYIDIRTDDSGYHRMVILGSPKASWTEPTVYDGTSRSEFADMMRIDYVTHGNARPWLAHFQPWAYPESAVEDRDSVVIRRGSDGELTAVLHNGLTHEDTQCIPIDEVMGAIRDLKERPVAPVININAWRSRAGHDALHNL